MNDDKSGIDVTMSKSTKMTTAAIDALLVVILSGLAIITGLAYWFGNADTCVVTLFMAGIAGAVHTIRS